MLVTSSSSAFRCLNLSRWPVTMGRMDASAEFDVNGIGVVRAGELWKWVLRNVPGSGVQRSTYARLLPQLNSSECVGGCSVIQSVSCLMFAVHLRFLVLLDFQ